MQDIQCDWEIEHVLDRKIDMLLNSKWRHQCLSLSLSIRQKWMCSYLLHTHNPDLKNLINSHINGRTHHLANSNYVSKRDSPSNVQIYTEMCEAIQHKLVNILYVWYGFNRIEWIIQWLCWLNFQFKYIELLFNIIWVANQCQDEYIKCNTQKKQSLKFQSF